MFAEGMRNTPEIAEKAMVPGRQNDFNGKRGVKSRQGLASGAGGWAGFAKEKRKTTARRNVAVVDSDVSGETAYRCFLKNPHTLSNNTHPVYTLCEDDYHEQ